MLVMLIYIINRYFKSMSCYSCIYNILPWILLLKILFTSIKLSGLIQSPKLLGKIQLETSKIEIKN